MPGAAACAQQIGHVGPTAHRQALRDPFQAHRRLSPQPLRHRHLAFIPFAPPLQILIGPPPPFPFRSHLPLDLLLPPGPDRPGRWVFDGPLGSERGRGHPDTGHAVCGPCPEADPAPPAASSVESENRPIYALMRAPIRLFAANPISPFAEVSH